LICVTASYHSFVNHDSVFVNHDSVFVNHDSVLEMASYYN